MLKNILTGLNNVVCDLDKLDFFKKLGALIVLWGKNISIVPNLWSRCYNFSDHRSEWCIPKEHFYYSSCLFKTKEKWNKMFMRDCLIQFMGLLLWLWS